MQRKEEKEGEEGRKMNNPIQYSTRKRTYITDRQKAYTYTSVVSCQFPLLYVI